jgi:hypothetical protein
MKKMVRDLKKNIHDADGNLKWHFAYEFDGNGKRVKRSKYTPKKKLHSYALYSYNEEGQLTKITDFNNAGEICSIIKYELDSFRRKAKKIIPESCTKYSSEAPKALYLKRSWSDFDPQAYYLYGKDQNHETSFKQGASSRSR